MTVSHDHPPPTRLPSSKKSSSSLASRPLPQDGDQPARDMKVLSVGLPRTGSTSLAEALSILGYQDVYHTSRVINRQRDWEILERAADATFSCLPSYTGVPFTRAQWDELYGSNEATTDAASMFAPELIAAYPEAKVVLVERDYDRWFASIFDSLIPTMWGAPANFSVGYIEPLLGSRSGAASRKMVLGLFGARDPAEARSRAREAYDRHGERIREVTPPERLLVYKLGDGWGPLCEFLGKEVPDEDFPWTNEAEMLRRIAMGIVLNNVLKAAGLVLPWVIGVVSVAAGMWMMLRR